MKQSILQQKRYIRKNEPFFLSIYNEFGTGKILTYIIGNADKKINTKTASFNPILTVFY